jgi:hypothetical protein
MMVSAQEALLDVNGMLPLSDRCQQFQQKDPTPAVIWSL